MSQRAAQRGLNAGGALGPVGAEEFLTGRRVEEQIPNAHGGTLRAARLLHQVDISGGDLHAHAHVRAELLCRERYAAHAGDRRQRFAAKAQRPDGLEPPLVDKLAGRVPKEADARVLGCHTRSVVRHTDKLPPAGTDLRHDGPRSGVESVLHQLLDRAGRPLDHLAGGDHVGNMGRQYMNMRHGVPPWFSVDPRDHRFD